MKLDLTSFDEKALEKEPYVSLDSLKQMLKGF